MMGAAYFSVRKNDTFRKILFPKIFSIQNKILHLLIFLEHRNFYTQNEEIGGEHGRNFEIAEISKDAEYYSGSKIFFGKKIYEKYHIFLTEK